MPAIEPYEIEPVFRCPDCHCVWVEYAGRAVTLHQGRRHGQDIGPGGFFHCRHTDGSSLAFRVLRAGEPYPPHPREVPA